MTRPDPYADVAPSNYLKKTKELVREYPLSAEEISSVTLEAWESILATRIGNRLAFGKEYKPTPQMMGNFLHVMIPVILEERFPGDWRMDEKKDEKDLVYVPNSFFDTEIKTSSSNKIFGNRSAAQPAAPGSKDKAGFFLAINFQSFKVSLVPRITMIRLGWLSHEDWRAQAASTGQQASLSSFTYQSKFVTIYST